MNNSKYMVIVSQLNVLCPWCNLCGQPVKVNRSLTTISKLNNVMHFTFINIVLAPWSYLYMGHITRLTLSLRSSPSTWSSENWYYNYLSSEQAMKCQVNVLHTVWCYTSGEAAGGNVKLITHESERVKLSSYGKVRYLLGGGGVDSWGFRGEGHQWNFGVMGKGTRILNLWKSGEVHALRYKKCKICKISNAFSAIQGAQLSQFPRGTCPRTPLAPECFNAHTSPISLYETCVPHSMVHHMHIFHCQFLKNLSQLGQDTLRTSWHVSHIFWELVNATASSFKIEIERCASWQKYEWNICSKSHRHNIWD